MSKNQEARRIADRPTEPPGERWWQHPIVLIAWSVAVAIVYALFPSTDTATLIALSIWGVGCLVWMAA